MTNADESDIITIQCVHCGHCHEVAPLAVVTCPCGRRVLSDRALERVLSQASDLRQAVLPLGGAA